MRTSVIDAKSLLSGNAATVLTIFFVPFLALADFLLFRQAFFYFDFEVQFIPFHYFASLSRSQGESMLWNPYIMLGFPQHGEAQLGVFYPVNLLLHWLPNQTYAVALSLYLHLVIAAAATYLLGRECRFGRLAALHAAVCFSLSGYMFAQFTNYNIVLVSAYLPLKLWLITRYFGRGGAVYLLYFALASASELLVSHANMSFITSVAAGLYFVIMAVLKSRSWSLARDLGLYAACSVLAALLAAVQLIPTFEFFTLGNRSGGLDYGNMVSYSHAFANYLTTFFPMMYGAMSLGFTGKGQFEETYFFLGSFGILLALFGMLVLLLRRDNRLLVAVGVLGLVGLLLSLGSNNPFVDLYRWLIHVPGFNLFRCPARWSLVLTLALAIFSGYGLQALIAHMQERKFANAAMAIAVPALVIPLIVFAFALHEPEISGWTLVEKITQPPAIDPSGLYSPVDRHLYSIFTHISPLAYFLAAILALLIITLSAYRLPAAYCAAIVLVLGSLDMLFVIKPMNPARSPDLYAEAPSHIAYVQQNVGVQRAVSTGDVPTPISLNGSAAAVYGIQTLTGWAALSLQNYNLLSPHISDPAIQDYTGVKYEIRPADDGSYTVIERMHAFPRAFLLEHHWVEHNMEAAFHAFLGMNEAARRTSAVILPESANLLGIDPDPPPPDQSGVEIRPANIVSYGHGRIEIEGEAHRPSFLLLTDIHYPGWQARVNGVDVPVVPLNGVFRGVYIDKPGPFSLEFDYRPLSFIVGAWLTLSALLLWVLLCRVAMLRSKVSRGQPKSPFPRPRPRLQRVLSRARSVRAG